VNDDLVTPAVFTVYRPSDSGRAYASYKVERGGVKELLDFDGSNLILGDNWGISVGDSCVFYMSQFPTAPVPGSSLLYFYPYAATMFR
jgi:hypothetical protein